jgi:hypothetical protein
MGDVFLEIVISAADAATIGISSRDEVETPLEAALSASGEGEVTGGGGGSGVYIVEVEVPQGRFDEALATIRRVLREVKVPESTLIKRRKPTMATFSVYEKEKK